MSSGGRGLQARLSSFRDECQVLSNGRVLSYAPRADVLCLRLNRFFHRYLLTAHPRVLLLTVIQMDVVRIFYDDRYFQLTLVTTFLCGFSCNFHGEISRGTLYIIRLKGF